MIIVLESVPWCMLLPYAVHCTFLRIPGLKSIYNQGSRELWVRGTVLDSPDVQCHLCLYSFRSAAPPVPPSPNLAWVAAIAVVILVLVAVVVFLLWYKKKKRSMRVGFEEMDEQSNGKESRQGWMDCAQLNYYLYFLICRVCPAS